MGTKLAGRGPCAPIHEQRQVTQQTQDGRVSQPCHLPLNIDSCLASPRNGMAVVLDASRPQPHSWRIPAGTWTSAYAGFDLLLIEPFPPLLPTTGPARTSTTDAAAAASLAYDVRRLTNDRGGGPIRARTLSDDECACGGISNGVDEQGGDAWPTVVYGSAALILERTAYKVGAWYGTRSTQTDRKTLGVCQRRPG